MSLTTSLILIGAAAGLAASPDPEINTAAVNAIEFCATEAQQSKVTIPVGYVMYQAADGALATFLASKRIPTTASAPALVQRFAATSAAARFGSVVSYLEVRAKGGTAWIVLGNGPMNPCDVFITGVEKIAETQNAVVDNIASNSKWKLLHASQASGISPLMTATYSQSAPKADKPNFGMRLKVQSLRPDLAKPDGIQLEASVISGRLSISPTGINVSN